MIIDFEVARYYGQRVQYSICFSTNWLSRDVFDIYMDKLTSWANICLLLCHILHMMCIYKTQKIKIPCKFLD